MIAPFYSPHHFSALSFALTLKILATFSMTARVDPHPPRPLFNSPTPSAPSSELSLLTRRANQAPSSNLTSGPVSLFQLAGRRVAVSQTPSLHIESRFNTTSRDTAEVQTVIESDCVCRINHRSVVRRSTE
ncbi:hypothetical protein BCR34DRAFT_552644 [Clohesyomyces aquaticus]|uniref:Uncharacterized protein n=1 Tax=Clohesyomyces aquaticus TaxID=1231657 RepID=A0A1Y2AA05_9PLEO|nr:hypothetical protein BCR34DRAFT_552644 [Clohesyomyces aquaticus]